jgi:arabinogalactan oligomer/maltooligosaccharide transport system permease protein
MVSWSGKRKTLTILLFILPTLLGLLLVNIYPMVYQLFISFTNRNMTYNRAPCEDGGLANIIDPTCWTLKEGVKLRAQPYQVRDELFKNYTRLFEKLVSTESLISLGKILVMLLPLIVAWFVVRQVLEKRQSSAYTGRAWLLGWGGTIALWFLLNVNGAINSLMDTGDFFVVMFRSVLYVLACIPFFFLFGFVLALILNSEHLKGRAIWRVLLIVPWAMQAYISALVWQFFFRGEAGTINQMLGLIGIEGPTWLLDSNLAFFAVVLVNIWMSYPFFMVVILGALQSIPQEQYEAAEMDGATWWNKITQITLPLLRPAVMPAVVLSSITTFQMFNTVWMITGGGPTRGVGKPGATELVMIYAYQQFRDQNYARIAAFAIIVFIVLFIATLASLRVTQVTKGAYE